MVTSSTERLFSCLLHPQMLEQGESSGLKLGWPARRAAGEAVLKPEGSPAPGLDFLDWLVGYETYLILNS